MRFGSGWPTLAAWPTSPTKRALSWTRLKLEYADNDSKRAALTIAGDAPVTHIETRSAGGREFRALVTKANVGEIFDAALSKRSVDGASAELQKHYGLDPNQGTACHAGEELA